MSNFIMMCISIASLMVAIAFYRSFLKADDLIEEAKEGAIKDIRLELHDILLVYRSDLDRYFEAERKLRLASLKIELLLEK